MTLKNGDRPQATLLMSKDLRSDENLFNRFGATEYPHTEATSMTLMILREEIAPDQDEAVFRGEFLNLHRKTRHGLRPARAEGQGIRQVAVVS